MTSYLSRRTLLRAAGGAFAATVAGTSGGIAGLSLLHGRAQAAVTDPALLSALEAASLLQAGQLHPRELLDACLRRSSEFDGPINSWVRTYPELAYQQADEAAQRLAGGNAPLLCGVPIALKDLFSVQGLPVTASSRVLAGNIASGTATAWQRLRDQGAVLLGHTHTDEFAFGTVTPQVGNPWDTTAIAGGSSGGSAAALAARFVPLALGTDTGGSLRIPASRTGVSAIKPTFGRVSRYGVIPNDLSRDHVGAMGRSLADAALVLSAMAGPDLADPATSVAGPMAGYPASVSGRAKPLTGKIFGVDRDTTNRLPAALGILMSNFLDLITHLGGQLRDIAMPRLPAYTADVLGPGQYHRQFAGRLPLYQPATAATVGLCIAGASAPIKDYVAITVERARFAHDYNRLFADRALDAVIVPAAVTDRQPRATALLAQLATDTPMTWANYAGAPVIALPAGRSAETGLPFGVQLGGIPWSDNDLITIGLELQAAEPLWKDEPALRPGPRELPHTGPATPGPGSDPTNTVVAPAPVPFAPTTATH
ncbi:amidase [Nocardia sp. NPDC051750]|uniref:amidase n=1 Tax=Nocardia sp. NPDC051750 TaxID=3364325 RepID=UPI0037BD9851